MLCFSVVDGVGGLPGQHHGTGREAFWMGSRSRWARGAQRSAELLSESLRMKRAFCLISGPVPWFRPLWMAAWASPRSLEDFRLTQYDRTLWFLALSAAVAVAQSQMQSQMKDTSGDWLLYGEGDAISSESDVYGFEGTVSLQKITAIAGSYTVLDVNGFDSL